ncbi:histidine triad nucleotide-binding protein [Candidatus Berkelbacteria bacterium]|nr:histidine triad nucleotide-binding protein [Candidatus Berkelbacteria bacterium]
MENCLFCSIAGEKTETQLIYKDDQVVAFADIDPKAPVHILIVPKKHIASTAELQEADEQLVGQLVFAAKKIAAEEGIEEDGYRLVFNTKSHGGQIIDHIHLHLLGGQKLGSMV